MVLGLIAMVLMMDWVQGKDFREVPNSVRESTTRTVNDGTNDLVNLADQVGTGASVTSKSRKSIGADGLEGAGDGGRPGKSSPPKGPGETAREIKISIKMKRKRSRLSKSENHTS
jgi:hypothetical protein